MAHREVPGRRAIAVAPLQTTRPRVQRSAVSHAPTSGSMETTFAHDFSTVEITPTSGLIVQRQGTGQPLATTPVPGSPKWQAASTQAETDKLAKEQSGKLMDAAFAEVVLHEPVKGLLAKGKQFAGSPEGIAVITSAVVVGLTALVLGKQELPVTSYKFDLGLVSKDLEGISITPTWRGPVTSPTEAGVKVVMAPKDSPISVTEGVKVGPKSSTLEAGIGIKPGGFLADTSLSAGIKVSDRPFVLDPLDPRKRGALTEVSAGVDYKPKTGPLSGAEFGVKGTIDDVGNKSLTIGLTIPLGSAPKPHKPSSE